MSRLAGFAVPVAGTLLVALTACSGDDKPSTSEKDTSAEVLASAKQTLDETSGVNLKLATDELPSGVSGVVKAEGVATHQPAFEGDIDVVLQGFEATINVTSVDGKVYAQLPFTPGYSEVDPAEYNAPDPAELMDPETGISSWLTSATKVAKGKQTRDGSDVLTSYTGSLDGAAVTSAIPSAATDATYAAVFTIDDQGALRTASVTGEFYAGEPELTYDVTFTGYGTDKKIAKP